MKKIFAILYLLASVPVIVIAGTDANGGDNTTNGCTAGWIIQRWDDVLSLCNAGVAGADSSEYQFYDFQWYKDGIPIMDAQRSYLYVPEGLEAGASYHLEMCRISNGERIITCPLIPNVEEDMYAVKIYPSPIRSGEMLTIKVNTSGLASIYDTYGHLVRTLNLLPGENSTSMNVSAGVYVVVVTIDDRTVRNFIGVI